MLEACTTCWGGCMPIRRIADLMPVTGSLVQRGPEGWSALHRTPAGMLRWAAAARPPGTGRGPCRAAACLISTTVYSLIPPCAFQSLLALYFEKHSARASRTAGAALAAAPCTAHRGSEHAAQLAVLPGLLPPLPLPHRPHSPLAAPPAAAPPAASCVDCVAFFSFCLQRQRPSR